MVKIEWPSDIYYRQAYIDKVVPFMGQNIIKVFTGQRRVGKSYLLFQIMGFLKSETKNPNLLYINMEDLAFSHIKTAKDLNQYVNQNKSSQGKTYVFIDEIQDIDGFEDALRSLLLQEVLDIYCTGSNAQMLSGDIAGKLSGRYVEINVYSLSFTEFLEFHGLKNTDDSLELYLKYGGLPYLRHLKLEDAIVFEYLKNIYSTIVYRDIVNRYSVRNTHFLERLLLFLANNTGSLFSAKKISDFLKSQQIKISSNQVQTYISHIVNAFIIHKVGRYDIVGKRLFEIGEKYYFENLGIRHGLWGYRLEDRGKIMENVVYNHLIYKGYKVNVGVLGTNEIDFIAEKNNERHYFQVALTISDPNTLEREFGNLKKIKDNYSKTVITLDVFKGSTVEGITNIDLKTFLSS